MQQDPVCSRMKKAGGGDVGGGGPRGAGCGSAWCRDAGRVLAEMSGGSTVQAWLRSFRFILRAAWQLLGDFKQRIDTVPSLFKCHLGRSFVQVDRKRTKQNIGLLSRLFS